jgi:hypothetical protein
MKDKSMMYISLYLVFFVTGTLLLWLGLKQFLKTTRFVNFGLPVIARVVKILVVPGSISHVLEFIDKHNNVIRFEANPAAGARFWRQGEEVSVIYDPENPKNVKVISYWALYWRTIILTIIGLQLVILSVGYFLYLL